METDRRSVCTVCDWTGPWQSALNSAYSVTRVPAASEYGSTHYKDTGHIVTMEDQ